MSVLTVGTSDWEGQPSSDSSVGTAGSGELLSSSGRLGSPGPSGADPGALVSSPEDAG